MIDVYAAAVALVDHLAGYDVTAVLTAADLVPPAVVINPPTVGPSFGTGDADLTWTLYAVAADSGRGPALADLSRLLDQLAAAFPGGWRLAEPEAYPAGGDLGSLPAYRLTINQRLTQENTP